MNKYILSIVFNCFIVISSCNTTRITNSWKEPDKTVVMAKLNKILVVALFKTKANRRKAEDQMALFLNGKGIVSYNYFDNKTNMQNEDAIRQKIKVGGFDGAVTMRLIDVDREQNYSPGIMSSYPLYFRSFSGYYYRNWSFNSTPNYYYTTKTFTVEINVYSIKEDKIIWTGLTQTTDPVGVEKMTDEIVKVIYHKMVAEGFISKK